MEKSTSNFSSRIYWDYNATAPLAKSVLDWLKGGEFFQANPSAIHFSGKRAKRYIRETSHVLEDSFHLSNEFFHYFHSGATEGANTIFKGLAFFYFLKKIKAHFFAFSTDHLCILNNQEFIEDLGHKFHLINTPYDLEKIVQFIQREKGEAPGLINWTWVHNETGVIRPLAEARILKEKTNIFIHVDAVQSLGKIENDFKLDKSLDYYTYSGHKFGAMKGIGFSFIRKQAPFYSLISGGKQQGEFRSGTLNSFGIYSLKLALEEALKKSSKEALKENSTFFQKKLEEIIQNHGEIVCSDSLTSYNTFLLVFSKIKGQDLTMALDLSDIDVSSGSACSSGIIGPNRILLALGYSEDIAKNSLRISFSPSTSRKELEEGLARFSKVCQRFFSSQK